MRNSNLTGEITILQTQGFTLFQRSQISDCWITSKPPPLKPKELLLVPKLLFNIANNTWKFKKLLKLSKNCSPRSACEWARSGWTFSLERFGVFLVFFVLFFLEVFFMNPSFLIFLSKYQLCLTLHFRVILRAAEYVTSCLLFRKVPCLCT